LGLASADEARFMEFIAEHGKSYGTREEYEFRYNIFKNRLAFHKEHNAKNLTWTVGVNHMTDMSDEEIKQMLGYNAKDVKGTPCGTGECPLNNAVCCSDQKHCCPQGYTCNLKNGTCDKADKNIPFELQKPYGPVKEEGLADAVDWRTKGAVTPVKN